MGVTDNYKVAKIRFYSLSQLYEVEFKAFIKNFSDKYECNWSETRAFGRMDPLMTYQGTGRKITVEWDIPAESFKEAKKNLDNCSWLIRALYPNIRSPGAGTALNTGVFGVLAGFEFSPDFEAGIYENGGNIYPKVINASVEITVLHDHVVGSGGTDGTSFLKFPYNTGPKPQAEEPAAYDPMEQNMTTEPIQMTPVAGFSGDFGGEFSGGHFETEQSEQISEGDTDSVLKEFFGVGPFTD